MTKKKQSGSMNVVARRLDTLIFVGFAGGILFVVILLGFAIFNNTIQL